MISLARHGCGGVDFQAARRCASAHGSQPALAGGRMSASAPRGVTGAPPPRADRGAVTVTGTGSGSCAESGALRSFVTGAVVPLEAPASVAYLTSVREPPC